MDALKKNHQYNIDNIIVFQENECKWKTPLQKKNTNKIEKKEEKKITTTTIE